jgi:hypothetical protein
MTVPTTTMATKTLQIEFLFLDLDTCTRCRATDATLLEAIDRTRPTLEAAGVTVQLVAVQGRVGRARRIQQPHRRWARGGDAGTDHGHERDHPAAARKQQHRVGVPGPPDEPAADRAAQLHQITWSQRLGQVRGHLAVVQALHGQLHAAAIGRRGDRVAALGRVAVGGGQAHVDVLARQVAGPARHVQD